MKKVLVVGGGGRCHAICDALKKSRMVEKIYCAPGNAGISEIAQCVDIKETNIDELLDFAKKNDIYLTVVGPEVSLAAGIVDLFTENGLNIFGPKKNAARIESSKEFAKDLMAKYNIPTSAYSTFSDYDEAIAYLDAIKAPYVLKYDGLAAGKGVVIAKTKLEAINTLKSMLLDEEFGQGRVVIEDYLEGPEFSFMCFVDNEKGYPLALAQDHKRAYENDEGPNTGGMGCYSPLPFTSKEDEEYALNEIMIPTAKALVKEGCPFKGVLYGGLMKTKDGIKVIEFNARFGDPETEVVLPRLTSDIFEAFMAIVESRPCNLTWSDKKSVGIVMASKGYPGSYEKNHLLDISNVKTSVYHMGTKLINNRLVTNGGRVIMIVAMEDTLKEAKEKVLKEIGNVKCNNLFYRKDIGDKYIK